MKQGSNKQEPPPPSPKTQNKNKQNKTMSWFCAGQLLLSTDPVLQQG